MRRLRGAELYPAVVMIAAMTGVWGSVPAALIYAAISGLF
jgi:hypothetical protein